MLVFVGGFASWLHLHGYSNPIFNVILTLADSLLSVGLNISRVYSTRLLGLAICGPVQDTVQPGIFAILPPIVIGRNFFYD